MELARLRNGERSGPFEYFQWGKYNRRKVVDIIKEDPYYIMVAVKDWLYLSPGQATYFSRLYNGEIPPKFIREFPLNSPLVKNPSRRENNFSPDLSGPEFR